ncbi:MAG TPA: plastocyanin/azurin family copper-binding protein [Actinomycetota bacterium]|nr:plastocyanin/azurin family copper-binding protein [Actinomycetota bacterium]
MSPAVGAGPSREVVEVRRRVVRVMASVGIAAGAIGLGAAPAGAGGGGHCPDPIAEASGTAVDMVDACFTPTVLHAHVGETITFTNRDPMEHNVAPAGWGWGHVDTLRQGESFTASFDEAGTYTYACSLHPGMTGAVVVEPRASVTAASVVPDEGGPGVAIAIATGLVGVAGGYVVGRRRPRAAFDQPYQPASGA